MLHLNSTYFGIHHIFDLFGYIFNNLRARPIDDLGLFKTLKKQKKTQLVSRDTKLSHLQLPPKHLFFLL